MFPERRASYHGLRIGFNALDEGAPDVAKVLANMPAPKAMEVLPPVLPPMIKDDPQLTSVEEQTAAIDQAYELAIGHIYAVEDGLARHIGSGAKTHAMAIMLEVFDMNADTIRQDEGALSDLTEYLLGMLYVEKGVYMRGKQPPVFADSPDIQLVQSILNTWDIPDREFDPPAMYQRVT